MDGDFSAWFLSTITPGMVWTDGDDWADWVGWLPSAAGMVAAAGLLLDAVLGDPVRPTHPVVLIGNVIRWLDRLLNRPGCREWLARLAGMVLVGTVLLLVCLVSLGLVWISGQISPWLAYAVSVWGGYVSVAPRELARAAEAVRRPLVEAGPAGLVRAREHVGKIVGRQTQHMDEREVIRATVETVAENAVDALVAPVMYGLLFGMPGALVYRAINTLDSMLGYKNERYRYFGWAAARLDDLANWLPARLTGCMLLGAGAVRRLDVKGGFFAWMRDASAHPSPNSGIPEAVVAGLLGVRLGGINWYHGRPVQRAYLGQAKRPIQADDIVLAQRLLLDLALACGAVSVAYGLLRLLVS